MQMSGGKAEKVLTLPKPQQVVLPKEGCILDFGPVKACGPVSRENFFFFFFFLLYEVKQMTY